MGVKRIILAVMAISVIIVVAVSLFHPVRKSNGRIRAELLKLTPIGTHMEEVRKSANRTGPIRLKYDCGIVMFGGRPSPASSERFSEDEVIGVKSFVVYLGDYFLIWPFGVYVEAYYVFDENDRLIEIAIHRGSNQ